MQGFGEASLKAVLHSNVHFQKAVAKLVEAAGNPNWMDARDASQAAWQELKDACGNVTQDAYDGIHDELKEKVLEQYQAQYQYDHPEWTAKQSKDAAAEHFEERWSTIKSAADFVHRSIEPQYPEIKNAVVRAETSAQWKLWRFKNWLIVGSATVGVSLFVISHPNKSSVGGEGPMPSSVVTNPVPSYHPPDLSIGIPLITAFRRDNDAVQSMDAPAAVLPAAAAMLPPVVAAIQQQPVKVTATKNGVKETTVTSLGDFYYHVPEARHDIEQAATEAQQSSQPEPEHHFLNANPNNALHSGEVNPAWAQGKHLTDVGGSWDGRRGSTSLHEESH
jgi:hypothetical protein